MKIAYIDVETTGLDPKVNGIYQIGGIIEIDGEAVNEFGILMQPHEDDEVDPKALALACNAWLSAWREGIEAWKKKASSGT